MKPLPVLLAVALLALSLSSCGTIAVPCDAIETLTSEGAAYLCSVLSRQLPPPGSLTSSEKVQAVASVSALRNIIAGYRQAALAQAQVYTSEGNVSRAQSIVAAANELAAKYDSLGVVQKEYQGQ